MSLQDEINKNSKLVHTESYSMSIGELANLYKENELDIHPQFQRVFRWNNYQKSKLIESIMLNIPIPSIFVSQRDDGVWDVIDGVQRLSTFFQFMGILDAEDNKGEKLKPLVLEETKYFKSFKDMMWEDSPTGNNFTVEQRIFFKRAKISINIIKQNSASDAKYELFQRLNTGGVELSSQEVRNCIIIMENNDFFDKLCNLATNENFTEYISIPEKQILQKYDLELILRFLIAINIKDTKNISTTKDITEFLNEKTLDLCKLKDEEFKRLESAFNEVFEIISKLDIEFRKYNYNKKKFEGSFLSYIFTAVTYGIFKNIEIIKNLEAENCLEKLENKIKNITLEEEYLELTYSGNRSIQKYKYSLEFGERFFENYV